MSDTDGQIMFLVCAPCEAAGEKDFGVKLYGRSRIGWYQALAPQNQVEQWLMKHAKCGGKGKPDHWRLGFSYPLNHDQPKPKPVQAAIERALDG